MNGIRSSRKGWLLAGASWAAIACWLPAPAVAADYDAATEQQLRDAVTAAIASPDASSTITLTGNITLGTSGFNTGGKQITLITQGFTLSGTDNPAGVGGNIVIGPSSNSSGILTISGTLIGGSGGPAALGGAGLYRNSLSGSGTNTVVNNGSITGGTGGTTGGAGAQLLNVEFLTNNGTVSGGTGGTSGGSGVQLSSGATLTNHGLVQGGTGQTGGGGTGVIMGGSSQGNTVVNAGTIRGGTSLAGSTSGSGINVNAISSTAIQTIINSGTIEGGAGGRAITASLIPSITVVNSGTIRAGAGQDTAIQFGTGTAAVATLELQPGSLILGDVIANAAGTRDTLRLAGSGTAILDGGIGAGRQYQNFDIVEKTGSGTWILTADSILTSALQLQAGTLQIGNGGTSGSLTGDVVNAGTLAFNRSDTYAFAGVISGTGAVRQDGSGTTILSGANTYAGATSVNAGTLRAGAAGAFSPASAVTIAAGATLDLAGLDQSVAGLANAGLVRLGGAPGTVLTVAGNYTGNGGVLALNTTLGGDGSASDRLVISGGAATGDTRLRVINMGGTGAQTVEGIRVVQATNGGTTAAGAFRLDTRVVTDAFEYRLFRGGNTSADDWYLRSFLLATPASPETPATPSSPGIPLYRPEVALYAPVPAVARQMALATLGSLSARRGEALEIHDATALGKEDGAPGIGAWARAFGERRRDRWDGTVDARATGDLIGLQAGFDILRTATYGGGHRDVAGVYVAYADYNAPNVSGFAIGQQQRVGRLLMSGPTAGAYWTHFGPGGWYLDAVFQANWFDVSARSDFGAGLSTNGTGYAASLEAGYPIRFGGGWQVEPQAQVIWQGVSIDRARDAFSSVAWDEGDAVSGRIGARLQYTARDDRTVWQPYAKVNLWHAFSGSDRISFGATPITSRFGDTALEVGAGVTARLNQTASLYAHADYRWAFDGDSRGTAVQGSIGIRFAW